MSIRQLLRDEGGSTLIEFTIVLPLWLSLTFGATQAALMLWAQAGLQHGVEVAARCASLGDAAIKYGGLNPAANPTSCYTANSNAAGNATSVKSFAASNSFGLNPPSSVFTVSTTSAACTNGNLVTASYPFTAITYLFSMTLTAQSCYPTVPSS